MPKFIDLTGEKINEWKPIKYLGKSGWECKCSCGNTRVVSTNALINGKRTSCGHEMAAKDPNLTGRFIKKLKVLGPMPNGYWRCKCECGNIVDIDDYQFRIGKAVNCGDMTKHGKGVNTDRLRNDLTGLVFDYWTVIEYVGNGKWLCECNCENHTRKEINGYDLINGRSKSCGHSTTSFQDLTNKVIGDLTVIKYLGDGKWECKCNLCGETRIKTSYALKISEGVHCENPNALKDLTGEIFGEWKVLDYAGNRLWNCKCSCGVKKKIQSYSLISGLSSSCGHIRREHILNHTFGELKVLEYVGDRKYRCRCSCGKIINVQGSGLISGSTKSCGCKSNEIRLETNLKKYGDISALRSGNPREVWQIEALLSKESLLGVVNDFTSTFGRCPYSSEIAQILDTSIDTINRRVDKYGISSLIECRQGKSGHSIAEYTILDHVKSICEPLNIQVISGDRNVLTGYELDIYIPDLKLAIEYNGNYWHSDFFKNRDYHLNKSKQCAKVGIRLIHIFEYEYIVNPTKVLGFIEDIINNNKTKVYARQCTVKEIEYSDAFKIVDNYHIQGWASASIYLGIIHNNKVIGVMTLGKPRFNSDTEYEIVRLVWVPGYRVIGGSEKLFKYFLVHYKPNSIQSFCDLSKFTGGVYTRLGFKLANISKPNYRWSSLNTNKVYSRYESQKHKLLELGLGDITESEDTIMYKLGYHKIYDCGNAKFIWKPEN